MSGRLGRASAGLLVFGFICGLGVLAALVPVGHGFTPKGGGWFRPAVVGGAFTLHPLLFAVPSAACFVLGLLDWRHPWRVEQLDLLALAGFFPVAMLLSDDVSVVGLWLAAVCLGWLFCRMLGVVFGAWRMPELRPSISARWLGPAIVVLLAVRVGSLAGSNISDVGQASSLGAWRVLHGLHLYGAVSWPGPGGLRVYRPDSYGPFAYYAYIPFVAVFPPAPAVVATLLPALCFDALTLAGLHKLGRRLGGRPLAQAFVVAYLLYPFPDLSLMAETNDALIAALCVWTIVLAAERPVARGLLIAAAVLTKFLPALLASQFLGTRRGRMRYALTLVASLAAMLAWPLITSGPAQFLDSTFGYQLIQRGGGIQFSIWTYLPQVAIVARVILAVALVLLALSPMWRPEVQDVRQCAALAAALLIGAQLLLGYWFYSYLTWCYPLLVIAIIQARSDHEAADTSAMTGGADIVNRYSVPTVLVRGQCRTPDGLGGAMATADDGEPLLVRLLGPVRAWRGNHELELGGPQRQAVMAMLAMRANQAVSRSEFIDGIWGDDPPPSAVNALHVHVAGLRKALEPHRAKRAAGKILLATGSGYSLRLRPGQLDAEVFGRHLDGARASRAAGQLGDAVRSFDTALRLCHPVLLPELPGPWAEIERVRLGEVRLTAFEERAEIVLMLGRPAEAAAQLAGLVREHPLREGLRGQLMLALYRCGRQADALAVFGEGRNVLVEELGIEPGPGLRRLHEQILAADTTLDQPARTGSLAVTQPEPAGLAGPEQGWAAPAQLPGDVDTFTGRADELAALDRLATTVGPAVPSGLVISVSGTAGVGKTALAVRWARSVRHAFPDGQLYVNLHGYDQGQPVPAGDVLAGFLRAIGTPGEDIPREEDERAAAYRTLLDGRRMLVVLDNASTVEQVRPLLPGSPSSLVLVTSRDSLAGLVVRHGARRLDLDTLPTQDAVALLRALIGDRAEAEPEVTWTLARQCALLPLALRVAAELASASPAMTLAELTDELADEQRRLDLLDAGGDSGSAVRSVLSWSYRHLPAETARAFRLLGLPPGPDCDLHAAAALTASTHAEARRTLELLVRKHLVHRTQPGRYGMHDLLRAYAAGLTAAHDAEGERHAALSRMFDYYAAAAAAAMDTLVPAEQHLRPRTGSPEIAVPPMSGPAAARGWLDSERAVLVAVTTYTTAHGWPGHATRLAGTLYRYLESGGHYPDAVVIHSAAHRAARHTGDRAAEATTLTNLGIIDWRQGRYRQAAGHHKQALAISRETGDRQGEAVALNNLGIVYERQGRFEQAAYHYRLAAALSAELEDRSGEARSLTNLGGIDCRQGCYDKAGTHLQRALVLFREIDDRSGEAATLIGLGTVDGHLGRHERAADHYRYALALARSVGDRTGEVEVLNGAGDVLLTAGRPGEAYAQHSAALALAGRIGARYEQARAHDGLARAHHGTGDPGQARRHWNHALALFAALGAPEAGDVSSQLTALGSAPALAAG
jgi:DNA-binding SARP family transcriptional activator/tetratricopeptide (TPR) repeat protein